MTSFRTMRVTGQYNKKPLHILIDSGSTHNFLDIQRAKTIGCKIEALEPLMVTMANGNKLQISAVVGNFSWTIQHTTFTSDMMLIPLGCCDVVLGIEWLVTLGDITWNFGKLTMNFKVQGRRHVLRGSPYNGVKTIKHHQLEKVLTEGAHLSMLHLCTKERRLFQSLTTHAEQLPIPLQIDQILKQFAEVFADPSQLPPMRVKHNHQIPLLQGTDPVNKRPYRYAKHQKDIIDTLVQDMLTSGIIQNSSSPYASPMVLVGKKDGCWRLCVGLE
ncbi:putative nucleotidyltransferase, Ribonuclease H [Lupinus albus]|uniref:Putative nucleotidyltransferase, Ribonuclease H n=1 Tax=Lupinus albus TaxID=3870 RepID=A0A6A4R6G3_LUPAL|nr:putative nucleotidyltransferase, Ribonuclease H [Lupinus albus]